jgi:hypothetical protein
MPTYTVHEPPLRTADSVADPVRFAFVRDGFHFWAFLLAPLWMLAHRVWLVLVLYLVLNIALSAGLWLAGAPTSLRLLAELLIAILVGLEAGTLRRWTLTRRGWRNAGIVVGDDQEEAERRFFLRWTQGASGRGAARTAPPPSFAPPPTGQPQREPDGVIGLFPEPGGSR